MFNVVDGKSHLTETHEMITLSNNLPNNTSALGMKHTDNPGIISRACSGHVTGSHTLYPNSYSDCSSNTYVIISYSISLIAPLFLHDGSTEGWECIKAQCQIRIAKMSFHCKWKNGKFSRYCDKGTGLNHHFTVGGKFTPFACSSKDPWRNPASCSFV